MLVLIKNKENLSERNITYVDDGILTLFYHIYVEFYVHIYKILDYFQEYPM